jgi:hypothetical protein
MYLGLVLSTPDTFRAYTNSGPYKFRVPNLFQERRMHLREVYPRPLPPGVRLEFLGF